MASFTAVCTISCNLCFDNRISFICKRYSGELVESNEESIQNNFFPLEELPENIFTEHKMMVDDLLSKKTLPIIG